MSANNHKRKHRTLCDHLKNYDQNKMTQPDNGKHQEGKKQMAKI
jgi:hypothetical protein